MCLGSLHAHYSTSVKYGEKKRGKGGRGGEGKEREEGERGSGEGG